MNEVLPYFHYGRIPLPCHPEQHILCHSERSEESQGFRYYSNVSVDHDPAAFRFFASVRSTQNDKWKQCVQNDRLEHLILCHPERSEGSKSCRCFSNVSVDYAPTAFRFFASLRFAKNDKSGRSAQNDKFGSESLTAFKDKLREELFPTQCHPERSEGSKYYRRYSDTPVGYAPAALRFFASLRSAQNDKQGRCRQNDKQGQCVQTCP